MTRITSFQQLEVWQEAHRLVLRVYQLTRIFPSEEKFGLGITDAAGSGFDTGQCG